MTIDMVNHPPVLHHEIYSRLIGFGWTVIVRRPDLGPCWEWNGSRTKRKGGEYGQIIFMGKNKKAHRLSYIAFVGEIPDGSIILHKCDNPPCVNPSHLCVGTHKDNADDKVSKGRGINPHYKSSEAPAAKLTENDILIVREMISQGYSLAHIGRRFDVTKQCIWRIKKGLTWTPEKML